MKSKKLDNQFFEEENWTFTKNNQEIQYPHFIEQYSPDGDIFTEIDSEIDEDENSDRHIDFLIA